MKFLLPLLFLFSAHAPVKTCKDLYKGVFSDEKMETVIVRTKTHQTEVCEKEGINFTWRVHWLTDCEYYMVLEKDLSAQPLQVFKIGDTLHIKILTIYKDKYDWQASFKEHTFNGFNYIIRK